VALEADVVLGRSIKAGEKMFVDMAGSATIPVYDRPHRRSLASAAVRSGLGPVPTPGRATRDQQDGRGCAPTCTPSTFRGIPALAVPDNTKPADQGRMLRPDLNPTYYNFAQHAASDRARRPYKPRDKAKVENAVQVAQRWDRGGTEASPVLFARRVNEAIRELLAKLKHRPCPQKDGTRASVWEAIDRPALSRSTEPFDLSQWSRARVNIDYHVSFDSNLYSGPTTGA